MDGLSLAPDRSPHINNVRAGKNGKPDTVLSIIMDNSNISGDSLLEEHSLFPMKGGGAIPTSPLQLRFKTINYFTAMDFLTKYHYLHRRAPVSFAFGAFFDNQILGALTIGKPASHTMINGVAGKENGHRVFELNRLCFLDEAPRNSESRFIGWCLRQIPKHLILVSYADTAYNHSGIIYRATGWKYTGTSIPFIDVTLPNKDHRSVPKKLRKNNPDLIYKVRSKKHRYVKVIDGDYSVIKWKITNYKSQKETDV